MWRTAMTLRWLPWHVLLVSAVGTCGLLAYWQLERALGSGGAQSAAYAMQWPVFAGFFIVVWWRSLRDDARPPDERAPRREPFPKVAPTPTTQVDDADDPELAAYNRMLADLNAGKAARR